MKIQLNRQPTKTKPQCAIVKQNEPAIGTYVTSKYILLIHESSAEEATNKNKTTICYSQQNELATGTDVIPSKQSTKYKQNELAIGTNVTSKY